MIGTTKEGAIAAAATAAAIIAAAAADPSWAVVVIAAAAADPSWAIVIADLSWSLVVADERVAHSCASRARRMVGLGVAGRRGHQQKKARCKYRNKVLHRTSIKPLRAGTSLYVGGNPELP